MLMKKWKSRVLHIPTSCGVTPRSVLMFLKRPVAEYSIYRMCLEVSALKQETYRSHRVMSERGITELDYNAFGYVNLHLTTLLERYRN
jgi:hypothetical protein